MAIERWWVRASAIGLAVVAGMVLSNSVGPTSAAPEKAAGRVQWEYKIVTGADEKALNKLGEDGWELIRVMGGEPFVSSPVAGNNTGTPNRIGYAPIRIYFRRPK